MLCICYGLLACQRSSCNRATTSIDLPQSIYGAVRRKIMTRIHMSEVVPPNRPHALSPLSPNATRETPPKALPPDQEQDQNEKGIYNVEKRKAHPDSSNTRLWRLRKKISPPMLIASKQRCERITWEALLYLCAAILGLLFMHHICDHSAACSSPGASVKHKRPCVVCRRHRSIAG